MTERTTVRLPESLVRRAKRKAAAEGRTLTALIEEGIRLVLAERLRTGTRKHPLPRVSKASGGLLSGADLTSAAHLQELEDLDYVRRVTRRG